jgi:hypothetical protein
VIPSQPRCIWQEFWPQIFSSFFMFNQKNLWNQDTIFLNVSRETRSHLLSESSIIYCCLEVKRVLKVENKQRVNMDVFLTFFFIVAIWEISE